MSTNKRRFRFDERGSLTLYGSIVLIPLLCFQFVLIDFVRIKIADAEEEAAIRGAVRSVLSAYDRELREYGLFGLEADGEEMAAIAALIMSRHGSPADDGGVSSALVKRHLSHVEVEGVYTLADHAIFRRQVLEEMKLKAPIEFTRHVYRQWQGREEELASHEQALEAAEEAEDLLEKREKALRGAFERATRLERLAGAAFPRYQHIPPPVSGVDGEPPDPAAVAAREEALAALYADGMARFAEMQEELRAMGGELGRAENYDNMLEDVLNGDGRREDELFLGVKPLGREFFADYEQGAAASVSMFGAFVQRLPAASDPDRMAELNRSWFGAFNGWYEMRRAAEEQRKAAFDDLERRKREKRGEVKSRMEEAAEAASSQVCSEAEEALYPRLAGLADKYMRHNGAAGGVTPDPVYELGQAPDVFQRSALERISGAAGVLAKIRDEVYVNEYVMYYFNYRTADEESGYSPADKSGHVLSGQEAEYVLYGMPSCTANRAAAYAEIYAVRFAVRLAEALLDVRKTAAAAAGSPLLLILTAAAEAAGKALQDMNLLVRGEEVPVFAKSPSLTMGYAGYLRLLMAVHAGETARMARVQALIELNSGIDLTRRPAYVSARSESWIRLWFLPGAAGLAGRAAGLQGKVDGNRYRIEKRAEMAY